MELVKNYVKKAMPSLSSDQMDTLMAKLEELGVLSVDDLSLVDPEDIKDTLPFSAKDSSELSKHWKQVSFCPSILMQVF